MTKEDDGSYLDVADYGRSDAPGMFFRADGPVNLENLYQGQTAFILCAGPSLTSHDLSLLDQRGILTIAVNNTAAVHRPNLWCCVDESRHFCDAIWRDPAITKFVPLGRFGEPVGEQTVQDMPAVFGYRRNERFNPETWLHEDSFNWGNHGKLTCEDGINGARSVLYVAIKLLYVLGVRRVYLLGCDFRMSENSTYCFEQERLPPAVYCNQKIYRALNLRLPRLLPSFEQADFQVYNCTPDSGLTVFPHVTFEQAVELARYSDEISTKGLYDKRQRTRSSLSDSGK